MQMICTKFQIKQTILVIAGELETNERLLTRRNMTNSERVHRVFLFLQRKGSGHYELRD